ncbi:MAG TPA: TlpA disulfide reductase family protein [Pirellulaceae bacterium]|jgi:thiol-disulfide isomerase/thioredoxin|nr:TlpA disulfide reductase family protein [Pirellulaceae bacterium]
MAIAIRNVFASLRSSRSLALPGRFACGGALLSALLFAGCGGGESEAEKKGAFEVARDGVTESEPPARDAGVTGGQPAVRRSDLQNRIDAAAAAPGNPDASAVVPPPSLAMEEFRTDPVPQNASAAELAQYLKSLTERQNALQQMARGMTEEEVRQNVGDLQQKRLEAARLLLAAEGAEDNARQMAVDEAMRAFQLKRQLGEDVEADYEAFLDRFANDRDPVIARFTRSMAVFSDLVGVAQQENPTQEQADAALAEVDALLADVEPNWQTLGILSRAAGELASVDRTDLATAVLSKLDAAYAKIEDQELQEQYRNDVGGAKSQLVSVEFQKLAAEENPPQDRVDAAVQRLEEVLASAVPSEQMFQTIGSTAEILIRQNRMDLAATVQQKLGDAFVKAEDPEMKQLGEIAQIRAKLTQLNIAKLLADIGTGEDEAANRLVEVARQLIGETTPPPIAYLGMLKEFAETLEYVRKYEQSKQLYSLIAEAYGANAEADIAAEANRIAEGGLTRLALIGTKLELSGMTVDGQPFDWESYRGKIVLVDFWATWCQPCLQELPNVEQNYQKYKDQGFDVVGVNLDDELSAVKQFLTANSLPWTTIVTDDPSKVGFDSPMAKKYGVEAIPFVLLVDRDGVVLDIHVRGADLGKRLAELYGESAATAPGASSPAPVQEVPAPGGAGSGEAAPPAQNPADGAAPSGNGLPELAPLRSSAIENVFDDGSWFVSADAVTDDAANVDDAGEGEERVPAESDAELFYASPDLTLDELVDFVFDMEEKPRSVQALKGFDAAIADACDRIWRHPDATVPQLRLAATTKMKRLHRAGTMGNAKADDQLAAYAERLAETPDAQVKAWVELVRMERKAVAGETLRADKLPELLAELKAYFEKIQAEERHLRLSSLTVRLINRIDDPAADDAMQKELAAKRETEFKSFGDLFAKSDNKELSRYGKKLAKPPAAEESDLVGKQLELEGDLADGGSFDWASYRGKVVIVDFWATWCGPCRREMPHVKEAFDKLSVQGFEVVGISLDEDQEALAEYLEENQIEWDTLAGERTTELAERYGVRGIPTMMLVDRDGTVLMVGHQAEPLIKKAEQLLAAK